MKRAAHPEKNGDYGETMVKKRKTYTCEDCSATFTEKYNVERHIRSVHTKDFPYPCEDCDHGFRSKGRLETHIHRATAAATVTQSDSKPAPSPVKVRSGVTCRTLTRVWGGVMTF